MKPGVIELLKQGGSDIRFLLDSGAFTAWKAGKSLKLPDYLKFIDGLPFKPWRHFMLDVIGDPAATRRNYEDSLRRGYRPVPIFTRGESIDHLDFYYQTSDLVAVGGLVGTRGNTGFVNGIMRCVAGRKVHWLGFIREKFLNHYKPYSADSSSVTRCMRWGLLDIYCGGGKWITLRRVDFHKKPSTHVLEALQRYRINPALLADRSQWKNKGDGSDIVSQIMYRAYTYYQHDIEEKLGVKLFIAGSETHVRQCLIARQFWRDRGVIPPRDISERTAA